MSSHATEETEPTERDDTGEINDTRRSASCTLSEQNRDFISSFFILVLGCAFLYLIAQEEFVITANFVANVAILWVASSGVGYLFQAVGIPPLLGSMISGIVLQNAADSFELSPRFGSMIETLGLCVILLISSTEIDIHSVANAGGASLRLTCLPGLVEAAVCAAASYWIFDMPIALVRPSL